MPKKKPLPGRRTLGLIAVLLGPQLLSACVVLPVPAYRPRAGVVVEVDPPHYHEHHRQRDWRR